MIAYVQCMMPSDVLMLLLLHISDRNKNKEHADVVYGMDRFLI